MPFLVPLAAAAFVSLGVGAITAGILGGIVVYGGLALITTALRPSSSGGQRDVPEQQPFGIKTQLQSGGVVPRSFGFGKFCTAGSEFYPLRTWGNSGKTPNAYLTRFIALSDLPMDSLTAIIVNDQRCTYGSGSPDVNLGYAIPEFVKDGVDHLWVKFYDGTQTSADAWAVTQFGSDADYPYGSDQVGRGVAYVMVTALIHQELFSAIPQYKFEGLGAKFYDPRLDTSVGGSGSHRWGQPATYQQTYNPAVIKYNVLRGVYHYDTTVSPPTGKWLFGLQGTAAARLPLDSWFAAMNEDDQSVETEPSVFAAQFQCGGQVDVDKAPVEFVDELNKCDAGRVAEAGGIFKTRSGAAGSAVMSFTDADFITTQPQSFEMFPGLDQTINAITATYPDPTQNWEFTDAPSLFDATLESADGGRRLIAALQLNYVFRQPQVQRLMRATREESRQFRTHHVIAPPIAFQLEPLDIIAWTSTANGYSSKLFQVIPTDQSDLDQGLVLVEVDPADYDWTPGADYTTYTPVSVVNRAPPSQNMSGWAVSAVTINGAGGRVLPAIKLQWDVTGIDDVDGILYEVIDGSSSPAVFVVSGESERFSGGYIYISENIQAATTYQVRGKYRPTGRNRVTNWSSYLSVTTGAKQIVGTDIADAVLTYAKFAASIEPVQVVSTLGAASTHEGATAFNTTDGQLYRYHSGAWTVAVPAVNVGNGLTGSQIAALTITGSNLVANTITAAKIAAATITATEIASDTITAGNIAANAITSSELSANSVVAGKIAAAAVNVDTILANNVVVTGHLVANAISQTDAASDTSGTGAGTSLTVTISANAYAVIVTGYMAGGLTNNWDFKMDGGYISYSGGLIYAPYGLTVMVVLTPSSGSHTFTLVPDSGVPSSALVVQQLKR